MKASGPTTPTYGVLARSYDQVMDHVDYPAWARHLESMLSRHRVVPESLLEVAAGTCYLAALLDLGRDCRRVHTDLRPAMLEQAIGSLPYPRLACDMKQLPFAEGSFDLVLCLYDAFNYLLDSSDVAAFLSEVRRVVRPGGHLLFDITTETSSTEWFADTVDHQECLEADVIRHAWYDETSRIQHNKFRFYLPAGEGLWQRAEEHHQQKIYRLSEVQALLAAGGMKLVAAYDGFGFGTPSDRSLRIHLLARRL